MELIHEHPWHNDTTSGVHFYWWCEGCQELHIFGDAWEFDRDFERPTVSPSIKTTHHAGQPTERICHVFIRGGQVEYLSDCCHDLAGQTRPLLPVPDGWFD